LLYERCGGRLIFRVEDTDKAREITGAATAMSEDLRWLGISFTEGEGIGGAAGPYRQSERSAVYNSAIESLLQTGFVYRCFCSQERTAGLHEEALRHGKPPRYDRFCRNLDKSDIDQRLNSSQPFVIRLAMDPVAKVRIDDLVKGAIEFLGENLDDLVIVRSDGSPTGILAGAVDDFAMGVTHIFRGDEWLPSTPYQYRIFEGLQGKLPLWGHLSLLVDENHNKLSKRTAGLSIAELREEGLLPAAINRYLAGLGRGTYPTEDGWTIESLSRNFDPAFYRSGELVYSKKMLLTENQALLRRLTPKELLSLLNVWDSNPDLFGSLDASSREQAITLATETAQTLSEIRTSLLSITFAPDPKCIQNADTLRKEELFESLLSHFPQVDFTAESIQSVINLAGKSVGLKGRELYLPIRLALTGEPHGPKLIEIMLLLGHEECIRRFYSAKEFLFSL